MTRTATPIAIPKVMLGLHITQLFDAITGDWQDQQHIAEPALLSDAPFKRMKFPILFGGDHSAFFLGVEHVLAHPSVDLAPVVGPSEWDLAEFTRPTLEEWRRRWWSSHPPPRDRVLLVELTEESLASWRKRKQARRDLPPHVPVPVSDLREALESMAWSVAERSAEWQRLTHPRHPLDLLLPSDPTSASASLIALTTAWQQGSNFASEAEGTPDERELSDGYKEQGEPTIADLIRVIPSALSPAAARARLTAAAALLR